MRFTIVAAILLIAGTARSEQWLQRYHDAQHTSFINVPVDPLMTENFRYIFDPTEVPLGRGVHLIHYTDPKIEANGDMLVPIIERNAGGVVTGSSVRKLSGGVEVWTYPSDFVRQPNGAWEPVFDFAVKDNLVYVMGRYGCIWILSDADGTVQGHRCSTEPVDPTGENIWITSPFTIDGNGNIFWTIRSSSSLIGSSIVMLDASGNITASALANLAGTGQIAGANAAPAVSFDNGTLYVATTLSGQTGGKLVALDLTDPTLQTVTWIAPLNPGGACREARLNDSGTSSPIALPDGGAGIGGWNTSPSSEGWYYSFDSTGSLRGCYPFGWDDTMGQVVLNGTTYLVGKHNHYTLGSSACNNTIDPPVPAPCFEIVVLDSTTMVKLWSYIGTELQPSGVPYEFCIDAPTLYKQTQPDGTEVGYVVAPSESGTLYSLQLFSNPPLETHLTAGGPQDAAYVPTVSIGGNAYTINHGQVVGIGR